MLSQDRSSAKWERVTDWLTLLLRLPRCWAHWYPGSVAKKKGEMAVGKATYGVCFPVGLSVSWWREV